VHGGIGAELTSERQLLRIAAEPGDDDLLRAGGAGRDDGAEPALSGAQDDDTIPGPGAGNGGGPREPRGERIEHHRDSRRNLRVHLLEHGIGRQVHVLGVAAPELRRLVDVGVAVGAAPLAAEPRLPARTRLAAPAAVARPDGDAVTLAHAPSLSRVRPDLLDDAEWLVTGDDGERRVVFVGRLRTFVLLVVAAADAARLDPEQSIVRPDGWPRELPRLEGLRLDEHGCADACHVG